MSTETQWFYASGGTRQGPVSESTLRTLIASGAVDARTLVWTQGMPNWRPLGETPLGGILHATPPPLTSQAQPGDRPGESTATVALVCSCLGLAGILCCCAPAPLAIVGVILAHVNLASPSATPKARERSRAALVVGYSAIAIYLLLVVSYLLFGVVSGALPGWLRHVRPGWPV
jgi:hypothetical protein